MRKQPKLTHGRLLEVLDYNQKTGDFIWKTRCGKGYAGEKAGSCDNAGYRRIMISGERFLAHRLAWFYVYGEWPCLQIDHIDADNSNNCIENLRLATNGENQANRPIQKNNRTGFKGVGYSKRERKYIARIKVNKKLLHLGTFETAEEAHEAYARAANDNFGVFARAA